MQEYVGWFVKCPCNRICQLLEFKIMVLRYFWIFIIDYCKSLITKKNTSLILWIQIFNILIFNFNSNLDKNTCQKHFKANASYIYKSLILVYTGRSSLLLLRIEMRKECTTVHDRTSLITSSLWSQDRHPCRSGVRPLWPAAPDYNKPEPSIIVVIILIHFTSSMLHPPNPGTLGDLPEARFVYHEGIQIGCNLS